METMTIVCQGSTQVGNKDIKSNFTFIIDTDVIPVLLENECKVRSRAGEGKKVIAAAGDGGEVIVRFERNGDDVRKSYVDKKAQRQGELIAVITNPQSSQEDVLEAAAMLQKLVA